VITVVFLDDQGHPSRFLEGLDASVSSELDNLALDVARLIIKKKKKKKKEIPFPQRLR